MNDTATHRKAVRLTNAERESLCIGGDCDYYGYRSHSRECQEHLATVKKVLATHLDTTGSTQPVASPASLTPPPLTAMDFVEMYLAGRESAPVQGHYVESRACRMPRPSGNAKDSDYRCPRCDGEALLAAANNAIGGASHG